MNRKEIASIIGEYSRQGFSAILIGGRFYLRGNGYRSLREARLETGIDISRSTMDRMFLTDLRKVSA